MGILTDRDFWITAALLFVVFAVAHSMGLTVAGVGDRFASTLRRS